MKLITLSLLWIVFCIVHSWLISVKVNTFIKNNYPDFQRWYRILYNLFSLVTIAIPIYYARTLHFPVLFKWTGTWEYVRYFLLFIAAIYGIGGALTFNIKEFIGIKQLLKKENKRAAGIGNQIHSKGILAYVRHPWYAAALIVIWLRPLSLDTLIENLILSTYLVFGTYLEERKLIATYGDEYKDYRKKVSMFVPLKFFTRRQKE